MKAFIASSGNCISSAPMRSLYSRYACLNRCRVRSGARASTDDVDISPRKKTSQPPNAFTIITDSISEVLNPPPSPVVLARRPLDQDFAVLLMRAGYSVVDDLDFVAMDEFQAQFFEIRSREWEKFIQSNFGMHQGILTDPRYFDFISYAQMLTIQFFMRDPRVVFEEKYGDENGNWGTRVVRRDLDRLETPQDILVAWRQDIGKRVYQRLLDTVRRPQPVSTGDVEAAVRGIAAIYDYLELTGFCLKVQVFREQANVPALKAEMIAPCILWGSQALKRRRSIPNDYDCFAVEAFCLASGMQAEYSTLFSKSSVTRLWTVT